jgi:hypothetical protein
VVLVPDAAFEKYGYVATLARTIPDLKTVLSKALAQGWDADKFAKAVQDTQWWKNSADSVKQLQILKATKPGEYKAQRDNTVLKVRAMAGQMGVSLGEGKGSALGSIVDSAMRLGWDDATLQLQIGNQWRFIRGQTSGGQAGALQQQLREMRAQYGAGQSEDLVAGQVKAILRGTQTLEGYKAQLAQAAKSWYPGFSKELDEGRTMAEIADPYTQTIAQTLEMSPSEVSLRDPMVQRALQARDPKNGTPLPMTLWQVQDMARQDKRYDHTTQAVNDAYSMLGEIGKGFGFSA